MSALEFVHLTSTLLASADGKWHIQKSVKPRTGEPVWWLLRREEADRYKRIAHAPDLEAAKTRVKELEYE